MGRILFLFLLLILVPSLCLSQSMKDTIDKLFPRLEGSEEEFGLVALIKERLDSWEIGYRSFNFKESETSYSFSDSIEVNFQGTRRDTLIICVPLNHSPDASLERSGEVNIEIALELINQAAKRQLPLSLKFLFLGAEFGDDDSYPMGSRLFLDGFFPEYPVSVLYLNLRSVPRRLLIRCGGERIVSPDWLLDSYSAILKQTDIPFLIMGNENQLFRMGMSRDGTIIEPYLMAGYPSVSLEGIYEKPGPDGREKWLASFYKFFWRWTASFTEGIPQEWDRHYLFFQVLNNYLIFPETGYIILLMIVLGVTILYPQIFSMRFNRNLMMVIKGSWLLLAVLLIWFFLLTVSTYCIRGILWVRNSPALWEARPLLFLIFKLLVASLLYIILFPLLRRLPYHRYKKLFSSSALLVLLLNIVILAFVDISFTYYFLWAYFFIFLLSLFRNRSLKLLCLVLSPFWLIKGTIDMFTLPNLLFCRTVLLATHLGNLLITVFLLPYVLLIMQLGSLFPMAPPFQRLFHRINALIIGIVSAGFLGFFLFFSPFSPDNLQKILVTDIIDSNKQTNRVEISSAAPLGRVFYWEGDTLLEIDSRNRRYFLTKNEIPDLLNVETSSTHVLDRSNIQLLFKSTGRPFRLVLTLSSKKDFILYDSNFPFVRSIAEETMPVAYEVLLGKHPPKPLSVLLTLPRGQAFTLSIRMEYLDPPFRFEFSGKNKSIRTLVVYKKEISLVS